MWYNTRCEEDNENMAEKLLKKTPRKVAPEEPKRVVLKAGRRHEIHENAFADFVNASSSVCATR